VWDAARTAGYDDPRSATKTIDSGLSTVSWVAELVSVPVPPPGGARTRPRDHEDDGWPTEAPDNTPPEASGFWDAHPALRYTHDFAVLHNRNPWGLLGTVLARVNACVEPNIRIPGPPTLVGAEASLNMFVALVGKSGGGKSVTAKVARKMLDVRFGREPVDLFEAPLGSGEGLACLCSTQNRPRAARARQEQRGVKLRATQGNAPEIAGPSGTAPRPGQGASRLLSLASATGAVLPCRPTSHHMERQTTRVQFAPNRRGNASVAAGVQPARARGLITRPNGVCRTVPVVPVLPGCKEITANRQRLAPPPVTAGGSPVLPAAASFGACWAGTARWLAARVDRGGTRHDAFMLTGWPPPVWQICWETPAANNVVEASLGLSGALWRRQTRPARGAGGTGGRKLRETESVCQARESNRGGRARTLG
jgi:hypothetical protein